MIAVGLGEQGDESVKNLWSAFLTGTAATEKSRSGEASEGQEALRTAGLETGATIFTCL